MKSRYVAVPAAQSPSTAERSSLPALLLRQQICSTRGRPRSESSALPPQIEEVNRQVTSSSQDIQTSSHQLTELKREMQNLEIELQAQLSTVRGAAPLGALGSLGWETWAPWDGLWGAALLLTPCLPSPEKLSGKLPG